ncbi:MAG TPA: hypothetical protein P5572_04750 [Phycisphaerae bacterium]|nr:hypothetical protein [Phycisphaerae bacterium]
MKNDNVVDFGTAVIVGDFVPGERAGARLTSPCDGTIVAVQILWYANGAAEQSIQSAITINADAGTFPNPGSQLEYLEAPLLSPGFINEFRYTDENNTTPINVPVTTGQNFFVILEFAEATDVGGGGASILRDVGACQSQRSMIFAIPGGWIPWCFISSGNFAIRAVVDCQDPIGACCDGDANCTNDVEQDQCQGEFDTFFSGQACGAVSCPVPTGACCNGSGGCLDDVTEQTCNGFPTGVYAGNHTACVDGVCDVGACCKPDGSCADIIELACTEQNGLFEGAGTVCASTSCPQPLGACCIGTACVPNQTELNCVNFPGTWQGPASTCTPNPCTACTDGDADQDGDNDLYDFAAFQACFGGPDTGICACLDMDNDGDVDAVDMALFVPALTGP